MKVSELITTLKEMLDAHGDREVVLQRDPEGNGFEPLAGADDNCMWNPDEGEVKLQKLNNELRERGFTEEDDVGDPADSVPAIVLFP